MDRAPRPRISLVGGTLALVASVVGCSPTAPPTPPVTTSVTTSATPEPVDAAFLARADAACRSYADYNAANPFPFTDFDPNHPSAATLPAVGDFFDRNPANHTIATDLAALGAPQAGGVAWQTVLDDLRQAVQLGQEQIADARASDATAFSSNAAQTRASRYAVLAALAAAGFGPQGSCYRVYT